ncbi:MAG: c-type cytochrome [Mariprofundaceae bacterium]|nr:c-type cytochrome [Mariprofundaceae bacterium]
MLFLMACFNGFSAWAADGSRGALVAKARCATCHHLNRSTPLIGPSLQGIFNRKPSITGVPFSRWGEKELDAWINNPRAIKPNTKMHTPPIAARDRADLIAYFKGI